MHVTSVSYFYMIFAIHCIAHGLNITMYATKKTSSPVIYKELFQ